MNANTSREATIVRVVDRAPYSWEIEEHEPEDLRSADEFAADDAGISQYGEL